MGHKITNQPNLTNDFTCKINFAPGQTFIEAKVVESVVLDKDDNVIEVVYYGPTYFYKTDPYIDSLLTDREPDFISA